MKLDNKKLLYFLFLKDALKKIKAAANSDGLINCLLQPGLLYLRIQKSMREGFNRLIKICGTWTDPATETKSIGLQADAQVVMVFARHLDNSIVTQNSQPSLGLGAVITIYRDTKHLSTYRDLAKTHANPDTDGN